MSKIELTKAQQMHYGKAIMEAKIKWLHDNGFSNEVIAEHCEITEKMVTSVLEGLL